MSNACCERRFSDQIAFANAAVADLDVGVIYSGERHFLLPLLDTMSQVTGNLQVRLILVDNASRDGVAASTSWPGTATVLYNARPLSYAANLNRILAAATARYVLLLNTDMEFDPAEACLSKMVGFMDCRPACGVSICRVYHPDGGYAHPARRFQTLATIAARRLGLAWAFRTALREYLYLDRDPGSTFACDWISGCFLMLRRAALADVGGFDERFAKYLEDVDFCDRLARSGWQAVHHGGTWCYHHEQRASRQLFSLDAARHLSSYVKWMLTRMSASRPIDRPRKGSYSIALRSPGPPRRGLVRRAA
ncbi:MAG TPA: glycosyltransferase [Pirellulales bacterium]|nr:glycosyltransferase [Pirellulales bacterium]